MSRTHPETPDPTMRTTMTPTRAASPRNGGRLSELGRLMRAAPPLDEDEERRLVTAARQGDAAARDTLIRANIRLALSIASDYIGRETDIDGLVGEGLVGLIIAADRYDLQRADAADRPARFATYATFWIRQRVRRFACGNSIVRVPLNVAHDLLRIRRAQTKAARHGQTLDLDQAARAAGLTRSQTAAVRDAIPAWAFRAAAGTGTGSGGRDDPEAAAQSTITTRADSREPDPADAADRVLRAELLGKALRTIPRLSRDVMVARYGLDGQSPRSLEEIGQTLGVTRQRVDQIHRAALRKLRARLEPIEAALFDPDRSKTRRP